MRKIIFIILILIGILIIFKDSPCNPISIKNGLTFEIPYRKVSRFYISGLDKDKINFYTILKNKLVHNSLESTQVLYDGELISDSSINYYSPPVIAPKKVTIYLRGDLDPQKVRGWIRRFLK